MSARQRHHQTLTVEVFDAIERQQPVIPVGGNKLPLFKWKRYQTVLTTFDDLKTWEEWYGDNIGGWARITGQLSRVIVLDDDKAGWMARFGLKPHVRTGSGGFHWIGQHPGWYVKTINSKISRRHREYYPNLDIRGDGGYSLIAGFNEKGGYTWLRSADPDPLDVLPRDLREFFGLLEPPRPREEPADEPTTSSPDQVPIGILMHRAVEEMRRSGRNLGAFWLAQQLRDNGYTRQQALNQARLYVRACPSTNTKGEAKEFTTTEFEQCVENAYSVTPRRAWTPRPQVELPQPACPQGVSLPPPARPEGVPMPEINR